MSMAASANYAERAALRAAERNGLVVDHRAGSPLCLSAPLERADSAAQVLSGTGGLKLRRTERRMDAPVPVTDLFGSAEDLVSIDAAFIIQIERTGVTYSTGQSSSTGT
jgi:hypothetical protein